MYHVHYIHIQVTDVTGCGAGKRSSQRFCICTDSVTCSGNFVHFSEELVNQVSFLRIRMVFPDLQWILFHLPLPYFSCVD